MKEIKIVVTDYYYPNIDQELEIFSRIPGARVVDCTKIVAGGVKGEDEVVPYVRDADAVVTQFAHISRKVVESMEKCRIVARYAIGLDRIDLAAAKEKGIAVANVPDYCIEEVSDTAMAHILGCVRKVTPAHLYLHEGTWSYEKIKPLRRLSDLTLGLLSFGNIARRVAEKIRPFGTKVFAHDPYYLPKPGAYDWVSLVSLEDLFRNSDIVSVHTPFTKETHHLVSSGLLSLMKKGSILVNTSRGGLVDEVALEAALKDGTIAMAGLDVLEYLDEDYGKSVLMKYPDRVILTPHLGWYSEQSIRDLQWKVALNVYEKLVNGKAPYEVRT